MNRILPLIFLSTAASVALAQSIAETPIWTAQQAHQAVTAGDVILLDIRTPQEWAQTGVAKGAWPVSMHEPQFAISIREILAQNRDTPIALICATGARSAYMAELFQRNGITDVIDVSEGMSGSTAGIGWVKAGLPIVTRDAALAAIPEQFVRQQ